MKEISSGPQPLMAGFEITDGDPPDAEK